MRGFASPRILFLRYSTDYGRVKKFLGQEGVEFFRKRLPRSRRTLLSIPPHASSKKFDGRWYLCLLRTKPKILSIESATRTKDSLEGKGVLPQALRCTLIEIFVRVGKLDSAVRAAQGLEPPKDANQSVVRNVWNPLIHALTKSGRQATEARSLSEALSTELYARRLYSHICGRVDFLKRAIKIIITDSRSACEQLRSPEKLRELESSSSARRLMEGDSYLCNAFIKAYGHCGSLGDAKRVFDSMPRPDIVSWNILIQAYSRNKRSEEALLLFDQMEQRGFIPDAVSLNAVLSVCAEECWVEKGERYYSYATEQCGAAATSSTILTNTLINMYGKEGRLQDARRIFDDLKKRGQNDIVTWNVLMSNYNLYNKGKEALLLFEELLQRNQRATLLN